MDGERRTFFRYLTFNYTFSGKHARRRRHRKNTREASNGEILKVGGDERDDDGRGEIDRAVTKGVKSTNETGTGFSPISVIHDPCSFHRGAARRRVM